MGSDTGWPDPARPGVPMNPERDGQHWVGNVVREWLAQFQMWQDRHGYCVPPATWGVLPYGGPCLTPAEVAAREAAAFKRGAEAMRKKAANHVRRLLLPDDCGPDEAHGRFQQAIASCEAIRALPVEEMRDDEG